MEKHNKLEIVDFTKALAITCIVIYHITTDGMLTVPWKLKSLLELLSTGNHAFLFMSGFGLYYSYKRKPLKAPEFWLKRLSKIYFPYIVVVIIAYNCFFVYYGGDRFSALLSHIFLYKMFIPEYVVSFGGHFWFISTILQFYFVFPLLVKIYNKAGTARTLLYALAASLIWAGFTAVIGKHTQRVWNSFFLQFLFEFCAGMAAADHAEEALEILRRTSPLRLLLIGICGYSLLLAFHLLGSPYNCLTTIPGAVGFIFFALAVYRLGIKPFNTLMAKLSVISYEWYLVHCLILSFFYYLLVQPWYTISVYKDILFALIIFFITLAAAYVYHYVWQYINSFVRSLFKRKNTGTN